MKRLLQWAGINIGTLVLFLIGEVQSNELLLQIALFLLWFVAVGGTIMGLITYFFERAVTQKLKITKVIIDGDNGLLQFGRTVGDTDTEIKIRFSIRSIYKIDNPSVPISLDILMDLIVSGCLFYYGYEWLTMFYLLHIIGLYKIRIFAAYLISIVESARIIDMYDKETKNEINKNL